MAISETRILLADADSPDRTGDRELIAKVLRMLNSALATISAANVTPRQIGLNAYLLPNAFQEDDEAEEGAQAFSDVFAEYQAAKEAVDRWCAAGRGDLPSDMTRRWIAAAQRLMLTRASTVEEAGMKLTAVLGERHLRGVTQDTAYTMSLDQLEPPSDELFRGVVTAWADLRRLAGSGQ